jgi:hypothetical protein
MAGLRVEDERAGVGHGRLAAAIGLECKSFGYFLQDFVVVAPLDSFSQSVSVFFHPRAPINFILTKGNSAHIRALLRHLAA